MSVEIDDSNQERHNEAVSTAPEAPAPKSPAKRGLILGVILLVILVAAGFYLHSRGTEDTDDAEIDGHLVPIASRIDGTVQTIKVDDNQIVKAGDVLVELDSKDYQVSLSQAKAQYEQASAQVNAAGPNVPMTRITSQTDLASGNAEVAAAEAAVAAAKQNLAADTAHLKESQAVNERSQANFQRYQTLFDKHEVSRADYDQYKATAAAQIQTMAANQATIDAAEQVVKQRLAQLAQQKSKLEESRSNAPFLLAIREAEIKTQHANTLSAQAAVDKADLNVRYGRIVAPVDGVVTQRSAEPGARVSSGQQLLMIVQTNDLWVTANFKETQLAQMHPGQKVKVYVDALRKDLMAKVESMPAVTGARTSVLPPENATGNYVKVIQRLPVRIRFEAGQPGLDQLRPGMSVEPKVYVK